ESVSLQGHEQSLNCLVFYPGGPCSVAHSGCIQEVDFAVYWRRLFDMEADMKCFGKQKIAMQKDGDDKLVMILEHQVELVLEDQTKEFTNWVCLETHCASASFGFNAEAHLKQFEERIMNFHIEKKGKLGHGIICKELQNYIFDPGGDKAIEIWNCVMAGSF
ncbi:hypothetical protein Tsubulata_004032, partial [Turnera subulata]